MGIKHNVYVGGEVQSLGFVTDKGKEATVGVILPGIHHFGKADRTEHIHVISGTLISGNNEYDQFTADLTFTTGDEITLECKVPVAYICYYG